MTYKHISRLATFLVASLFLAATAPALLGRGPVAAAEAEAAEGGRGARSAPRPSMGPSGAIASRTECLPAAARCATGGAVAAVAFARQPGQRSPGAVAYASTVDGDLQAGPSAPAAKPVTRPAVAQRPLCAVSGEPAQSWKCEPSLGLAPVLPLAPLRVRRPADTTRHWRSAGDGDRPGVGTRPGTGDRPGIADRPGVGDRPGFGTVRER